MQLRTIKRLGFAKISREDSYFARDVITVEKTIDYQAAIP